MKFEITFSYYIEHLNGMVFSLVKYFLKNLKNCVSINTNSQLDHILCLWQQNKKSSGRGFEAAISNIMNIICTLFRHNGDLDISKTFYFWCREYLYEYIKNTHCS